MPNPDAAPEAVERDDPLSRIIAMCSSEETMKRWDSWRRYIAEGGGGSWPRDAFESLLSAIEQDAEDVRATSAADAAEVGRLTSENARLREALEQSRIQHVMFIAFYGRDHGTSRWEHTLDQLVAGAVKADTDARSALGGGE